MRFHPFYVKVYVVTLSRWPAVQLVAQRGAESALCLCPHVPMEHPWVSLACLQDYTEENREKPPEKLTGLTSGEANRVNPDVKEPWMMVALPVFSVSSSRFLLLL